MAETFTSRLGLRIWGAGTDGPTRGEFNEIHQNIEDNAAMFSSGTQAARPAAGKAGRIYMPTDFPALFSYDTGSVWIDIPKLAVTPMTTSARNALAGANLWDGRIIANTTTDRLEYYDLGATTWRSILNSLDGTTYATVVQLNNAVAPLATTAALNAGLATVAQRLLTIKNQTGSSYTLTMGDQNEGYIQCTSSGAFTLTVPATANAAFSIGSMINLTQGGVGRVTVIPAPGVIVHALYGQNRLAGQYASATLVKVSNYAGLGEWVLSGQIGS